MILLKSISKEALWYEHLILSKWICLWKSIGFCELFLFLSNPMTVFSQHLGWPFTLTSVEACHHVSNKKCTMSYELHFFNVRVWFKTKFKNKSNLIPIINLHNQSVFMVTSDYSNYTPIKIDRLIHMKLTFFRLVLVSPSNHLSVISS